MKNIILALALSLPALVHAESCIVQKYKYNPDSQPTMMMMMGSSVIQLTYNPGNQLEGGDTVFHSEKIKGDMTIYRSSYFAEGVPTITIVDSKTGQEIAKSQSTAGEEYAKSPTSTGFAILNFIRNDVVYQMACE